MVAVLYILSDVACSAILFWLMRREVEGCEQVSSLDARDLCLLLLLGCCVLFAVRGQGNYK